MNKLLRKALNDQKGLDYREPIKVTYRIPESLDLYLYEVAEKEGTTINSVVIAMLQFALYDYDRELL